MSLSTSSSNTTVTPTLERPSAASQEAPGRAPAVVFSWKHMLIVGLIVFCALELFSRMFLFRISKDFHMFAGFTKHARKLTDAPGLRIALIGNSTTDDCTDAGVIQRYLENQLHVPVSVDAFAAGGSSIPTQYHIINRYFWQAHRSPDLYVVTFFDNRTQDQLSDAEDMDVGRLGYFFATRHDWPEIFRNEVRDPAARAGLVLSTYSATVAGRDRMAKRFLTAAIPHYKQLTESMNDANFAHQEAHGAPVAPASTYRDLTAIVDGARARGSAVCFVAYPTRTCLDAPYSISSQSQAEIKAAGASLVDLRSVPYLRWESYKDQIHLKKAWTPAYSLRVAAAIAPLCATIAQHKPEPTRP